MKKKALIILSSINIRNFEIKRYEFKYLKKKIYVEFHHFHNFLNKGLKNSFSNQITKKKYIYGFNSVYKWKKRILFLRKKYPNLFVFNILMKDKFKEILILHLIKELRIKRIDYSQSSIFKANEKLSFFSNLIRKSKNLFSIWYINWFIIYQKIKILNFLQLLFNINPDFILSAGRKNSLTLKKKFHNKKNIIIKEFSIFDRSSFLLNKNSKKIIKENYCVFLGFPNIELADRNYIGLKETKFDNLHPDTLFKLLNNFFYDFEKYNKTKIVIASHPKAKSQIDSLNFGGRTSFYDKTCELVKYCRATIGMHTVSISFSMLYKKPHFFIYNNSTLKNNKNFLFRFANLISSTAVNIEKYNKDEIFLKKKKINLFKYNKYVKDYLSDVSDNKPNYKVILDLIKKH